MGLHVLEPDISTLEIYQIEMFVHLNQMVFMEVSIHSRIDKWFVMCCESQGIVKKMKEPQLMKKKSRLI